MFLLLFLIGESKFVRGEGNKNTCPSNSTAILSEESCTLAAKEIGGVYIKSGAWSYAPKNCYIYISGKHDGLVYLNTDPGKADETAGPLCARQGW